MKRLLFFVFLLNAGSLSVNAQDLEALDFVGRGGGDQLPLDVAVDGSGQRITCGEFTTTANNFGAATGLATSINSAGGADGNICMYDANDQLIWTVTIAGTGADRASAVCISPDLNNATHVYVTGYFTGSANIRRTFSGGTNLPNGTLTSVPFSATHRTYFVLKLNDQGVLQWSYVSQNGLGQEEGYDIVAKSNVNYTNSTQVFVCGRYQQLATFASASTPFTTPNSGVATKWDGFVLAYEDLGLTANILWGNTVAGSGAALAINHNICLGIACGEKSVYVTGLMTNSTVFSSPLTTAVTLNPLGTDDAFVAQYEWLGILTGVQRMGGPGITNNVLTACKDQGKSICVDRDEQIYVTGIFSASTTVAATFGGLTLLGTLATNAANSTVTNDIFVVRMNGTVGPPATATWVQRYSSNTRDYPEKICVDNCGTRVYLAGNYSGAFTLGIGGVALGLTGTSQDAFVAELNPANGTTTVTTVCHFWAANWTRIFSVDINAVGDVSMCGVTANNMISAEPLTPGTLFTLATSTGAHDAFMARWDNSNYPMTASSSPILTHNGTGNTGCTIFTSGNLLGTATVFGTSLSSSGALRDAYMIESDIYGNPTVFVQLSNDAPNTTVSDEASDDISGTVVVCGNSSAGTGTNFPGYTYTAPTGATPVGFLCSYSQGWCAFVQATGGLATVQCYAVAVDMTGASYIGGKFNGTLSIRTPAGVTNTGIGSGNDDYFLIKIDVNGNLMWYTTGGGNGNDQINGIHVAGDQIYITGGFSNTATFNGNTGNVNLSSAGGFDMFAIRFTDYNYPSGTIIPTLESATRFGGVNNDMASRITARDPQNVFITANMNATTGYVFSYDMSVLLATQNWQQTLPGIVPYSIATANNRVFMGEVLSNGFTTYDLSGTVLCSVTLPHPSSDMCILAGNTHGDDGENAFTVGNNIMSRASSIQCGLASRMMAPQEDPAAGINSSNGALIFPNPFSISATIQLQNVTDLDIHPATLTIYDLAGRAVLIENNITTMSTTISREGLAPGVYIYRVNQSDKEIGSGKVVIAE